MARVVQRSSPPYLTILFVFLFVIAAGLAGYFYSVWRDAESKVVSADETMRSVASRTELSDPAISAIKARAGTARRTLVGQMQQDINDLVGQIAGPVGAGMSAAEAIQQARTLAAADGLVAMASDLKTQLAASQAELQATEAQLAAQVEQTNKIIADAGATQTTLADQLQQKTEELTTLQAKFDTLTSSYQTDLETANTEWEKQVRALRDDLKGAGDDIAKLEKKVGDLLKRIKILEGPVVDPSKPGAKPEVLADGEILKVLKLSDHTVVYIDIGRKDRVRIGLRFRVYSKRTGVSADAPDKGAIIVKSLADGTAECHVLQSTAGDPIVAGDKVVNLAFSSTTQPVFVVKGQFDLNGDGGADAQGAGVIKGMIERFGGKVTDQITVDTDYVVMGMVPSPGPRPEADAPETDIAVWQQNEQAIQRYHEAKNRAISMNKPILNTNQVLTYIGFVPEILRP